MCSVIVDDFIADKEEEENNNTEANFTKKISEICKKCKEKAEVVLQKKHSYCKNCFSVRVTHRFRSTLGKTKLMKQDDKVLIVFYGGDECSIALLHLIKEGMRETAHKRLRFSPIILFIDESALWPKDLDKLRILTELWNSLLDTTTTTTTFECYAVKLSAVYDEYSSFVNIKNSNVAAFLEEDENNLKLIECFEGVKNGTSKLDLLVRLRCLIQTTAAERLACTKIFTPECGTDLSIRLLSNVILGRGSQIPSDTNVCEYRNSGIESLRPLREITAKEIVYYNIFQKNEIITLPSTALTLDTRCSIQNLAESFVHRLQEEFPSTVYTIFHTSDKLKSIRSSGDKDDVCVLCFNNVEYLINTPSPEIDSSTPKSSCDSCTCNEIRTNVNCQIMGALCYGCRRLVKDLSSINELPDDVIERIKIRNNSKLLRSKIEDCLL